MEPFVYNALPSRVVFGHGTLAQLADEVRALGCQRALVLSTAHQAGKPMRWPKVWTIWRQASLLAR
jgi:alcohol dehydrogenase YqhD (iron-dependent ADH family)